MVKAWWAQLWVIVQNYALIVWVDHPKLCNLNLGQSTQTIQSISICPSFSTGNQASHVCCTQYFKYQMINKFSSIDNACHKQKKHKWAQGGDLPYNLFRCHLEILEGNVQETQDGASYWSKHQISSRWGHSWGSFFRTLHGFTHIEWERPHLTSSM